MKRAKQTPKTPEQMRRNSQRTAQRYHEKKAQGILTHTAQKNREWRLLRQFGMTAEDLQRMLVQQNGVCAICRKPETATSYGKVKALAIDHCHRTNRVRGLLCSSCNVGLGNLKDDPSLLRAGADYLERTST